MKEDKSIKYIFVCSDELPIVKLVKKKVPKIQN